MAGGSYPHAVLRGNFIGAAGSAVAAGQRADRRLAGCNATTSDFPIAVDGGKRYLYADAVVVCGEPEFDATIPTAVVNPVVVVEVLSPSSEHYDRGRKFEFYGALGSVREYLIIEQERRRVELRHRADTGAEWRYTTVTAADGALAVPSVGLELPMRGLYRNWSPPEAQTV